MNTAETSLLSVRTADRNYQLALGFDPTETILVPSGQIKLPIVAGGPGSGLRLQLPSSWTGRTRSLMFRLKLSKDGATSSEVTINQILFRSQVPLDDSDEPVEGGGGHEMLAHEPPLDDEPPAVPIVPLAAVSHAALAAAAPGGDDSDADSAGGCDAVQAAVRASHLELNLGMPIAGEGTMAAHAREILARSNVPLPGEGSAAVEAPSVGGVPAAHADAMQDAGAAAVADEEEDVVAEEGREEGAVEADEEAAEAVPPAALPPTPRPQRERKRKAQYGDNGELDGAASSFRSAPPPRKDSVEPSVEMGVPAYALPGEEVWAMGLHAGARKRFKAEVVKLRTQFPRIVVKYIANEDGITAPIALPEMRTAYVTMADVEAKDW